MDIATLVDKFGIPLVVCGVICFYLRKDVVVPLVRRIIAFLDCLEKVLEESEKRAVVNTAIAGSVDRRLANVEDICERIAVKLKLPPSTVPSPLPAQHADFFSRPPPPKADEASGSPSS